MLVQTVHFISLLYIESDDVLRSNNTTCVELWTSKSTDRVQKGGTLPKNGSAKEKVWLEHNQMHI